jgi:CheY-like chemotaxis protein
MPGVFGLTILEGTRQRDGFPPIILITAFGDEETHAHAARLGAAAMFDKPFEIDDLLTKMRAVLSRLGPTRRLQISSNVPLTAARMETGLPLARNSRMLVAARTLYASSITDGNGILGAIRDVFFNDRLWVVSYVVVETGGWPDTRRVLLSPSIAEREDWPNHLLQVPLTQQQVKDSPRVDTHPPVSQQRAIGLSTHRQPQAHWANPVEQSGQTDGDTHLRSAQEVTGYYVETTDGRFGHVEDIILEDEGRAGQQWTIRYLVVHMHRWLPGGKVVVASRFINSIDWRTQTVRVCLSRQEITDSPKFNP